MNNISNQTFHTIGRLSFLIIALFVISTLTGCDDNTIWIWDSAETMMGSSLLLTLDLFFDGLGPRLDR